MFCKFKCSNIEAALEHHPVIEKEVDELLAKGTIEQSTVVLVFNVLVVPKCMVV